ncbi:hypothetical protein BH23ACT9_BH23ACT9_10790 [soil metagenome]
MSTPRSDDEDLHKLQDMHRRGLLTDADLAVATARLAQQRDAAGTAAPDVGGRRGRAVGVVAGLVLAVLVGVGLFVLLPETGAPDATADGVGPTAFDQEGDQSIRIRVFSREAREDRHADVLIELLDDRDDVVARGSTGPDGEVELTLADPGEYTVRVIRRTLPEGRDIGDTLPDASLREGQRRVLLIALQGTPQQDAELLSAVRNAALEAEAEATVSGGRYPADLPPRAREDLADYEVVYRSTGDGFCLSASISGLTHGYDTRQGGLNDAPC